MIAATTGFGQPLDAQERRLREIDAAGRSRSGPKCSSGNSSSRAPAMKIVSWALPSTTARTRVVALEPVEQRREVGVQLLVERVRRRLVEQADGDGAVALDAEEAEIGRRRIQTLVW